MINFIDEFNKFLMFEVRWFLLIRSFARARHAHLITENVNVFFVAFAKIYEKELVTYSITLIMASV